MKREKKPHPSPSPKGEGSIMNQGFKGFKGFLKLEA